MEEDSSECEGGVGPGRPLAEVSRVYDALDRPHLMQYPDATQQGSAYDANGNVVQSVDANGSVVESEYDAADRLVQRTLVAAAEGVIGPTSESYGYDGLSRLVEETTAGRQVRYELDAVGNPQRTEYPSGLQVTQAFDALDRPLSVAMGTDGTPGSLVASYGYQGPYLRASKGYGSGQTATSTFDADRRLLSQRLPGPDDATVFEEALRWRGPPTLFLAARAYLHFCARIHALIGSSVCLVSVQSAALLAEVVARWSGCTWPSSTWFRERRPR